MKNQNPRPEAVGFPYVHIINFYDGLRTGFRSFSGDFPGMAVTEKENIEDENRRKILFALAILLGDMTPEEIGSVSEWGDLSETRKKQAVIDYKKNQEILDPLLDQEGLEQPQIQSAMSSVGKSTGFEVYVIENPGDGKTCDHCRKWIGKKVSDNGGKYPTIKEWMDSGGLHPNCRCSLHAVREIDEVDQKAKEYLERKQKRLRDLIAYRNSINSSSELTLAIN